MPLVAVLTEAYCQCTTERVLSGGEMGQEEGRGRCEKDRFELVHPEPRMARRGAGPQSKSIRPSNESDGRLGSAREMLQGAFVDVHARRLITRMSGLKVALSAVWSSWEM